MRWKPRSVVAKTAAAAALAIGGFAAFGVPAASAATNAGNATIIDTSGKPLAQGGSATLWQIQLPQGAACSGATVGTNFHVFTFIAPVSVNLANLKYDSVGPHDGATPANAFVYPLYGAGSPFISTSTVTGSPLVPNPQPGSGATFDWGSMSIDGSGGLANPLPAGNYNVGIACADGANVGDKYWAVQETFTASTADPNGETWTAANPSTQVPESPLTVAMPLSAVAVLAGGVVILRRRRSNGMPTAA
jgi:hypothetical protein